MLQLQEWRLTEKHVCFLTAIFCLVIHSPSFWEENPKPHLNQSSRNTKLGAVRAINLWCSCSLSALYVSSDLAASSPLMMLSLVSPFLLSSGLNIFSASIYLLQTLKTRLGRRSRNWILIRQNCDWNQDWISDFSKYSPFGLGLNSF